MSIFKRIKQLKFFCLFILSISSIGSYCQPIVSRASDVITTQDGRLAPKLNLLVPRYLDTTQASLSPNLGIDTCGALIFTYSTNSYWLRECSPKRWTKILKEGDAANTVRRSVAKGTLDSLQLVNDTILNTATGRKFNYQLDTTGRRAYYEDKYVVSKSMTDMRKLRVNDTSYIFRVNIGSVLGDFYYDPNDITTTDDSVMTIVSSAGYRYKRYNPDFIYDVRWFGAKCDGTTDDTKAVRDALRAVVKYSNDVGGVIRLINNKFDTTGFVYPNGMLTFLLNGDIVLINEWTLGGQVNIIGESGTINAISFTRKAKASIISLNTDTSRSVLHLISSGGYFENFNIRYPYGKGIWIDGWSPTSGNAPAAQKQFNNIAVLATDTSASIPFLIEHAIWIYINNCSFGGLSKSSYSIKMQNRLTTLPAYKFDMNATGLVYINDLTLTNKGIFMGGVPYGQGIGAIYIKDCVYEVPDSALIRMDSRDLIISDIYISNVQIADGTHYMIDNVGHNTNYISIEGSFATAAEGVIIGDPVNNVYLDGNPIFASSAVVQSIPVFTQWKRLRERLDAINANKGWVGELFKNPYGAPEDMFYKTDTTTGHRDPMGNHTAHLFSGSTILYLNESADVDSGDYVFAGAWVRSQNDSTLKSGNLSPLIMNCTNITFENTGNGSMSFDHSTGSFEAQGWTLLYQIQRISDVSGTVTLNYSVSPDVGNPLLLWKPWVMIIKDSLTRPNEVFSWAKETIGNIEMEVPKGARGVGGIGNLYIGDSTYWNWTTRKWYQNTQVPYSTSDSNALVTKKYADALSGGVTTMANIGSVANADGASISGSTLTLQPANASFGGVLTTGAQTIAGAKTFAGNLSVITASSDPNEIFSVNMSGGGKSSRFYSSGSLDVRYEKGAGTDFTTFSLYTGSTREYYLAHFNDGSLRLTRDATATDIVIDNSSNIGIRTVPSGANFHVNGTTKFNLGSDATGDMFYRNAAGLFTRVPLGTANQQLHVNSGATAPEWVTPSGTYTPTLTNGANVDATVAYPCQWSRVGNVITISGKIDVDATSNTTATEVGISLPVASAISNDYEISGTANCPTIGQAAAILGDASNNRASLQFICNSVGNNSMFFIFSYQVL
jgi:hypothetical protein